MAEELKVERLPPRDDIVKTTPEEVAWFIAAEGKVMTMVYDGELYRVIDPWEP